MPFQSLAEFIEDLGRAGELVRVDAAVDPVLEAAAVTERVARRGGPALLFGTIKGHDIPLLTNLLGTEGRICRALGLADLDDAANRFAPLASSSEPHRWFERLKAAPADPGLRKLTPRSVRTGACQQVVRLGSDVDLGILPVLQSWPGEAGRTITAARVHAADPDRQRRAVGRFDLELLDRDRLAAGWHAHDEPAQVLAAPQPRDERMPVAIVLGGDPALLLAAGGPLLHGVDPLVLAGLLREKSLEMVACRSIELEVPAAAEIVIEGYVDRREPPVTAGPRSTPAGRYSLPHPAPVVHVTAVTHRANPVYPAMVPGRPPHEACAIGRAMWRILLPLVRQTIPDLVDCDLPLLGAVRHAAFVSLRKSYAGQGRKLAQAVWGLDPLMFAKLLVIVDDDVDVHDADRVWAAVVENADLGRDVLLQHGPPDPLDAAAPPDALAARLAIDATTKLPGERTGPASAPVDAGDTIRELIARRWQEYGLGVD